MVWGWAISRPSSHKVNVCPGAYIVTGLPVDPPDLIIRNYESQDLLQCRALWDQLTKRHREIYQDPKIGGETPELKFDEHLAASGSATIWVAIENQTVVGLIGMVAKGNEAEVEPIIVAKSHRGRGIGKRLLETVIEQAQLKRVRLLSVKPVARNVEAIKFFHDHGFKNIGFIELFMDLSNRRWKSSIELFGCEFDY
jgi:ribosomal protein S18 acetylase RimI-like enzyme